MTSRGIRSNNPFNIERNETRWQGMADDQSSDPRFVVFKTPQYGIRAGAKVLLTYQNHDGCKTPRQIISRFAPPGENNTAAYIAAFCAGLGVGPDDPVDLDTAANMTAACKAIILHENGVQPYSDAQIAEGIRLAGVADAKPAPLATQRTFQAQVGTGVAVVGAAASQVASYAPTVKGWADQLGTYAGAPIIQHAATILLTVAGGLAILGIVSQVLKQKAA